MYKYKIKGFQGLGLCTVLSLITAVNAQALDSEVRLSTGLMSGGSGEYVYDADGFASGTPGYKISELQWAFEGMHVLGLHGGLMLNDSWRLNADGWVNLDDGDAYMVDFDWLYVGSDWSHWSHSGNTVSRDYSAYDLSGEYSLFKVDGDRLSFTVMGGMRQEDISWRATGGIYNYSLYAFRDTFGTFPDVPLITYSQSYSVPYVGLGVHGIVGRNLKLDTMLRYSRWVSGDAVDDHLQSGYRFEDSGDNGGWMGLELSLGYPLTDSTYLTLGYTYSDYEQMKGSTVVSDMWYGGAYLYPGEAAGMDFNASSWTLGVEFLL